MTKKTTTAQTCAPSPKQSTRDWIWIPGEIGWALAVVIIMSSSQDGRRHGVVVVVSLRCCCHHHPLLCQPLFLLDCWILAIVIISLCCCHHTIVIVVAVVVVCFGSSSLSLRLGPLSIGISLFLFRILFHVLIEFEIADREIREKYLEKKSLAGVEIGVKIEIEHSAGDSLIIMLLLFSYCSCHDYYYVGIFS